jgi:hypothetical protein
MTKTIIIDLEKIYNIVVDNFFFLKSFTVLNFGFEDLTFDIQIVELFEQTRIEKWTKPKL